MVGGKFLVQNGEQLLQLFGWKALNTGKFVGFLFALEAACMGSLNDPDERVVAPRHLLEFCWVWGGLLQSLETASKSARANLTDRCILSMQGSLGVHVVSHVRISVKPNL